MATLLQEKMKDAELSCCLGVWSLCNGEIEVEDRGDGIAEIALLGSFGRISQEDADAAREWDKNIGRNPEPGLPVGYQITSCIVGFVRGETEAEYDEDGDFVSPASAFPGQIYIGNESKSVASIEELETWLATPAVAAELQELRARHTKA